MPHSGAQGICVIMCRDSASMLWNRHLRRKETSWPGFEDEHWIYVMFGIVHPELSSITCSSGWLLRVMAGRDLQERG